MGLKQIILETAAFLGFIGCGSNLDLLKQDDYVSRLLEADTKISLNEFDRDKTSATPTKRAKNKAIIESHNTLFEKRNQHSLNAKYIRDLPNNWKFIAYAADTYSDNNTEINNEIIDYFTNSARADARIGKYLNAGKNVLVYVEIGGRAEVYAYSGSSDMDFTAGYGLLKTGLVRRNSKGEKTTKLQADVHAGTGQYNWNFPRGKLENKLVKVIATLQASQKLPIDINKISRINLVANASQIDTQHNGYLRQTSKSAEAGIEFVLDKIFLGKQMRVALYGGARQENTKYVGRELEKQQFGTARMNVDWKLTDRLRALLGWKYDEKNGFGAEAGVGYEFGSK